MAMKSMIKKTKEVGVAICPQSHSTEHCSQVFDRVFCGIRTSIWCWLGNHRVSSAVPRHEKLARYYILFIHLLQPLWHRRGGGTGAVVTSVSYAWGLEEWVDDVVISVRLLVVVLALRGEAFCVVHVYVCVCVCVCVTPNHFNKSKAFAIIQHLSTAMSALQQCLDVCVCVCVLLHPSPLKYS